jgi:hypothetical protein
MVDVTLRSAPSLPLINARLRKVQEARLEARKAKRENKLDEGWLNGVDKVVGAFKELEDVQSEMGDYISKARQVKVNRTQTILSKWNIIATVIGIIVGILITLFVSNHFTAIKQIDGNPFGKSSIPTAKP